MVLSIASCKPSAPDGGTSGVSGEGKLFTEPTVISIMLQSHPSWPFDGNWAVWRYIREATGADFDIAAVPNTEYSTKLSIMMASRDNMTDLVTVDWKPRRMISRARALIAIDDYLDIMPNYTKFWNSLPEEERERRLMWRKSPDGKTYFPQNYVRTVVRVYAHGCIAGYIRKAQPQGPRDHGRGYEVAKKLKSCIPTATAVHA